jgi:hypothetical protein
MAHIRQLLLTLALALVVCRPHAAGQGPRFFSDDPIQAMPEPLPVTSPLSRRVDPVFDFLLRSKDPSPPPPAPAGAINTLGDVPDSEWFVNRHGRARLSRDELQRGPSPAEAPLPPFNVVGGKEDGIMPGFRLQDSKGREYFVKGDPIDFPEMATSAEAIVSRFLYAIGYNTPANNILYLHSSDLRLNHKAQITLPGGRKRRMTRNDIQQLLNGIPRCADGSFRVIASLAIPGESIGPFRYDGTRSDDPNDIVPHEHRRDLRGLYVFSAWLNNTDVKAENTLDTVVEENGKRFIRHFLLDFGSALGSDGDYPKDARFGHEFMLPAATAAVNTILTLGLTPKPWERAKFPSLPGVGNFESQSFDPDRWKPNYPVPAFLRRLPDDDFWAAKQVMAFSNDDIRAIVETARFTDSRATEYMIASLAQRRDAIGRTFFSKLLPLDYFRVDADQLAFDDLAVRYGFQGARHYRVQWSRFNNIDLTQERLSAPDSFRLPSEVLSASSGSYFAAAIEVPAESLAPVLVFLYKTEKDYKIVGIERTW